MSMVPAFAASRLVVLGLLVDPQAQERTRAALRGIAELVLVTRLADANSWLLGGTIPAIAVVQASDADGASTAPLVRRLAQRTRPVPVVAYCSMHAASRREMVTLAKAGAHDVVFAEVDDTSRSIRQILMQAEQTCGAEVLMQRIAPHLPSSLHPLMKYCLVYPERATGVADVAEALGVHRRTLANACKRSGFPTPQELLTWCRLLLAGFLLESSTATVEQVALRVEFPTGGAMRNAARRYLDLRPADLRGPGAVDRVVEAFAARSRRNAGPRPPGHASHAPAVL